MKTNKISRNTYLLNCAVESAFTALHNCVDKAAAIGEPIRSLSITIGDEGERRCRVRYFKIPKSKKKIDSLHQ